jgi:hypothetical protein
LAAICSFPPDYKWPVDTFGEISSLMSRGVMPKVGEWLAENVARAINDGKKLNRESSEILDITSSAWSYGELQPAAVAQVSRETSDTPETRENLARAPLARNARVLLTGSTPMQVGSDRTQLKIITAVVGWRNALTDMGYAVEHRPVTVGEDLSGYAHVIAILNQPNSLASSYVHGAVWCLHSRPDTIIALDDWQVKEIVSGAQTFARSQERMTRLHAAPAEYRDMLSAMYDAIGNKPWPWRVIAPILGAGDTSLLGVPRAEVIGIDPTAYVPRYPMPDKVIHREKRWVQATLLAKPLPPITWPLAEYGPQARAKGGGGGAGDKASPRLVESDLMRVYASSWGIISPAHPHAGSGWWRVRYLMAVDAGAILSGDIREARVLGNAYAEASDMRHVERMTPAQLAVLAIRQRACFEDITWSKDRVKTALKQVLKGEPPMVRRVMPSASTPTVLPTLLPPRTPGEGSGAYIRRLLMAGHNDSNAILAAVHAQFEGSKAAQSDINWNKGKLKKEGWIPGASPPRPTPPVVPTVVATPVATKPAPARTNGALRSDVARPDERLAKLANTLDPKVANALADIIEWMVARHV